MPKREYDLNPLRILRDYEVNGMRWQDVQCEGCAIEWKRYFKDNAWHDHVHPEETFHPCCCCSPEELAAYRREEEERMQAWLALSSEERWATLFGPREMNHEEAVRIVRRYARWCLSFELHEMADAIERFDYEGALLIWYSVSLDLPIADVLDYLT